MDKILKMPEAAARLGVCKRTLERWVKNGTGPVVLHMSPRCIGILESDLELWLLSRKDRPDG